MVLGSSAQKYGSRLSNGRVVVVFVNARARRTCLSRSRPYVYGRRGERGGRELESGGSATFGPLGG